MENVENKEVDINSGGVEELKAMIADLTERDDLKNRLSACKDKLKQAEDLLEKKKESLDKEQANRVKEETIQATKQEDLIITETEKKLKDVISRRNKAKNVGVKNRIKAETKEKVDLNKEIGRNIRLKLNECGIPGFCGSTWYYTMYYPQGGLQWFIKILVMALMFVGLPLLSIPMCSGLKITFVRVLVTILVGLALLIIMAAVYFTLRLAAKDHDNGVMEQMRAERDKIKDNKRDIKETIKSIKNDKDDSLYGLGEYDEKINEYQRIIATNKETRTEKYNAFMEVRKPELLAEISNAYAPSIESAKAELTKCQEEYRELQESFDKKKTLIYDKYEKYLQNKYIDVAVANELIQIIQEGNAVNVNTAITWKEQNK